MFHLIVRINIDYFSNSTKNFVYGNVLRSVRLEINLYMYIFIYIFIKWL